VRAPSVKRCGCKPVGTRIIKFRWKMISSPRPGPARDSAPLSGLTFRAIRTGVGLRVWDCWFWVEEAVDAFGVHEIAGDEAGKGAFGFNVGLVCLGEAK
jgi:hypothetical protein